MLGYLYLSGIRVTTNKAILVDLDGTLADVRPVRHYVQNKPRNFHSFHQYASTEAEVNPAALAVVDMAVSLALGVVLCSGRHEKWRLKTEDWLARKGVWWDDLYLRKDDDFRSDVEFKREMYNNHISPIWKVILAVDDNPAIVALWRTLSIPVLVVPGWDDDSTGDIHE